MRFSPGRLLSAIGVYARHSPVRVLLLVGTSVAYGTLGYHLIEGWGLLDSVYQAVITISTVGFTEVKPLSPGGRVFTILFISVNTLLMVYVATTLTSYILEGHLGGAIRRRKMDQRLNGLCGHVIVCGYGRVGRAAAEELRRGGTDVVVIDSTQEGVAAAQGDGYLALHGSAYNEDLLQRAHLGRASGVIAALTQGSDNITLALTVRDMRADIPLVCRAASEVEQRLLRRAGATHVLSPYEIGGSRMATMLTRPEVLQFLDVTMHAGECVFRLESVRVTEDSPVAWKVLRETQCFAESATIVIGVIDADGSVTVNPPRSMQIMPGSTLIVLGNDDQIGKLRELLRAS